MASRILTALLIFSGVWTGTRAHAQCMTYPVDFALRVQTATEMVIGTMTGAVCYQDERGNIWTANLIQVEAWLKNAQSDETVAIITPGGTLVGAASLVYPSLEMLPGRRYALMLDQSSPVAVSPVLTLSHPGLIQALPVADAQGALTEERGLYYDLHTEAPQTEFELLTQVAALTGEEPLTPAGRPYRPRPYTGGNLAFPRAISTFSPNPAFAGTVNTLDWLQITGSGFGGTDTVWFPNANDGGATSIYAPVASDLNSWSTTAISIKVPTQAGTGPFDVANLFTSATDLTVRFSHLSINSSFYNFGSSTRQRYNLRDLNGGGGYTFKMNSAFFASGAKAPFERAIETWRCATFVNFWVDTSAVSTSAIASDGECTVLFDTGLPLGVLGRATSRFNGGAQFVTCEQSNTVWWLTEVDFQFSNPPFTGYTWNYGPGAPSGTEFDFESVALHEAGHGHGLGHVIDPGAVMHYSLSNGSSSRTLSVDDIAGGDEKLGYSSAASCFNPNGSGSPMTLLSSNSCVLTQEMPVLYAQAVAGKGRELHLEVNPSADFIHFDFERSIDGSSFQTLANVPAEGESDYYLWDTESLSRQKIYYRVRGWSALGNSRLSSLVEITLPEVPLALRQVNASSEVQILGLKEEGMLRLYQLDGKLVQSWSLQPGTEIQTLEGLSAGIFAYHLQCGSQQVHGRIRVQP